MNQRIPKDSTSDAHAVQIKFLRRLGGPGRVALLSSMSEQAREISRSGIRARHPKYNESEVREALSRMLLGEELFHAVFSKEQTQQP